jgi:hypothetical protein
MRELREMMRQVRKSLGNRRTTTRRVRTVPTLIREETAEPVRRVRRRETR